MSTGVREFERGDVAVAVWCAAIVALSGFPTTKAASARPLPALQTRVQDGDTSPDERQLAVYRPVLLNPSRDIDRQTRRSAAAGLIDLDSAEAHGVLGEGLRSGELPIVEPIVDALLARPAPVPALLGSAVDALRTAPPATWGRLSELVARYGEAGRETVSAAALNGEAPVGERVGPVLALGAFRSRAAAGRLMTLLAPDRDEEAAIVEAACRGLDRLTGLAFGNDPSRWQGWWTDASRLDEAAWFRGLIDHHAERRGELEATLEGFESKLYDTYLRLYPALPYDVQVQLMPQLLDDEMLVVRRFAIEQIERLLRDTIIIGPELQGTLARRLADPDPQLRLDAAELLDQLHYADLGEAVVRLLNDDGDPRRAAAYLNILATHPCVAALPAIRRFLEHETLVAPAANALWRLGLSGPLPEDERAATAAVLRGVRASPAGSGPAADRLAGALVLLGDARDVEVVLPDLDHDDSARRAAVAEALAARGEREPLLERAAVPAVAPFAPRALVAGPATLESVLRLIRLSIPADLHQQWAEAVITMSSPLAAADVLTVDEQLRASDYPNGGVRRRLLEPLLARAPDELAPRDRETVLRRLIPLLFEGAEATRAFDLLESVPAGDPDPLRALRLDAALRCARYERAAEISADPMDWIAVLEDLPKTPGDVARQLGAEIARRFEALLVGDARARFDAATADLPPAPTGDGSAAAAGGAGDEEPEGRSEPRVPAVPVTDAGDGDGDGQPKR